MLNDKESDCGTVKGIWTGVLGSFCFMLDSQASTKDLGRSCYTVGKKQGGDKCRNFINIGESKRWEFIGS